MKGYEENMGILNELYGGSIEINERAVFRNGEYYRTKLRENPDGAAFNGRPGGLPALR